MTHVLFNVYHGKGDPSGIDWNTPVASGVSEGTVELSLPLPPGEVHVLGVRAVSAGGVEEGGGAVTYVRADETGQLLPVLTPPIDVAAWPIGGGELALSFRYPLPPGLPAPESFEVLTDSGTGAIDLEEPLLTIGRTPMASRRERFDTRLAIEGRPLKLCVRACLGPVKGPLSRIVDLPTVQALVPQTL